MKPIARLKVHLMPMQALVTTLSTPAHQSRALPWLDGPRLGQEKGLRRDALGSTAAPQNPKIRQ